MQDRHMYFQGSRKRLSYPLLKKFDLTMEESQLKSLYLKHNDNRLMEDVEDILNTHLSGQDWDEAWRYMYYQVNHKKKKRWAKKAFTDLARKKLKNPKELYRLSVKYQYDYPATFEQKLNTAKENVAKWAEKSDTYMYEYPFFDEKTDNAKSASLKDDLALAFLYFIKSEWEADSLLPHKAIKEYPYDNQIVYANRTQRKPLEFDGKMRVEGEEKPYKDYGPKKGALRILIENNVTAEEMAKEFNLDVNVYDLDQVDRDLLTTVLEYRGKNFATDKTIEVKLGDLVSDVFHNTGSKNYHYMLKRLYKLSRIRFSHLTYQEVKGVITDDIEQAEFMGFFDYVRFRETEKGEIYLAIEINQGIHSRFINNQTLRIYQDQVSMLDSAYHSMLLYMQKERIKAYRADTNVAELTYTNFLTNIRFRHASKNKVREEIIDSLNKLIQAKVLVKCYTAGKMHFDIEFDPIDDQEVKDIIGEKKDRIDIQQLLPQKKKNKLD